MGGVEITTYSRMANRLTCMHSLAGKSLSKPRDTRVSEVAGSQLSMSATEPRRNNSGVAKKQVLCQWTRESLMDRWLPRVSGLSNVPPGAHLAQKSAVMAAAAILPD